MISDRRIHQVKQPKKQQIATKKKKQQAERGNHSS